MVALVSTHWTARQMEVWKTKCGISGLVSKNSDGVTSGGHHLWEVKPDQNFRTTSSNPLIQLERSSTKTFSRAYKRPTRLTSCTETLSLKTDIPAKNYGEHLTATTVWGTHLSFRKSMLKAYQRRTRWKCAFLCSRRASRRSIILLIWCLAVTGPSWWREV